MIINLSHDTQKLFDNDNAFINKVQEEQQQITITSSIKENKNESESILKIKRIF